MRICTSQKEVDQAIADGVTLFTVTDFTQDTPIEAPYQVGETVYLANGDFLDGSIPTEYINTPLKIEACYDARCYPEKVWGVDALLPDGSEFPYLITADNLCRKKPF